MIKQNRIYLTIAGLVVFMALIVGIYVYQTSQERHREWIRKSFQGTLLTTPRDIVPFRLQGMNGLAFNNESLKGHWTMMFFGFTQCGSICPTTLAELSKMMTILEKKQVKLPQVVMVSVDPTRDSLAILEQYLKAFHRNFYGARGDDASIMDLTKDMGVAYTKVAMSENADYNIEHTGTVMLLNPEGKLAGFFTMPHHAELLAKDYLLIL